MSYSGAAEQQANRTFFSVANRRGRLFFVETRPAHTSDEEAEINKADGFKLYEYKNREGEEKVRWEKCIPSLIGRIKEVKERDGKYAVEQLFILEDPSTGDEAQISVNKYMNQVCENLMNRMCNPALNLGDVVKLVPYSRPKDNGKKGNNEGVVIFTGADFETKIEKAFPAPKKGEKPTHDCPSWNSTEGKGKDKGKLVWDNNDTIEYLDKAVAEALSKATVSETAEVEEDDCPI